MGSFHVVGRTSLVQYLEVEVIGMVIVPNLFISWLYMTTQNVCPEALFMRYALMWSLIRSPFFDLSQKLELKLAVLW